MLVNAVGSDMLLNEVHPSNAFAPIEFNPAEIDTEVIPV